MRLRLTVELDPVEQAPGAPASAAVTLRPSWGVADLLAAAAVEAANAQLPPEWRGCVPAMAAVRVLAAGLRVGAPVVVAASTVRAAAASVGLRLLGV